MNTYSHVILTAVLRRQRKKQEAKAEANGETLERLPPLKSWPLMIGSFMPDFPLTVLTIVFIIYDMVSGVRYTSEAVVFEHSSMGLLFNDLFFNNGWVIAAQNLFHSPLLTLFYTLLGYWGWKRGKTWGAGLFWFGLACTFHTAIDIPLHHDDGPLLFYPFDWQTRFISPVSYWDPQYYGVQWTIFEHLLDLVLLIFLIVMGRERIGAFFRRVMRREKGTVEPAG